MWVRFLPPSRTVPLNPPAQRSLQKLGGGAEALHIAAQAAAAQIAQVNAGQQYTPRRWRIEPEQHVADSPRIELVNGKMGFCSALGVQIQRRPGRQGHILERDIDRPFGETLTSPVEIAFLPR